MTIQKTLLATSKNAVPIYMDEEFKEHMEAHKTVDMDHIVEAIKQMEFEDITYDDGKPVHSQAKDISLGRTIGKTNSVPITEENKDDVVQAARIKRDNLSNIIIDETGEKKQDTDKITVVVGKTPDTDNQLFIFTSFYGDLAPKEPTDPSLTEEERAESERYFSTHALAVSSDEIDLQKSKELGADIESIREKIIEENKKLIPSIFERDKIAKEGEYEAIAKAYAKVTGRETDDIFLGMIYDKKKNIAGNFDTAYTNIGGIAYNARKHFEEKGDISPETKEEFDAYIKEKGFEEVKYNKDGKAEYITYQKDNIQLEYKSYEGYTNSVSVGLTANKDFANSFYAMEMNYSREEGEPAYQMKMPFRGAGLNAMLDLLERNQDKILDIDANIEEDIKANVSGIKQEELEKEEPSLSQESVPLHDSDYSYAAGMHNCAEIPFEDMLKAHIESLNKMISDMEMARNVLSDELHKRFEDRFKDVSKEQDLDATIEEMYRADETEVSEDIEGKQDISDDDIGSTL